MESTAASDDTRLQILDAAEGRFRFYGYRKTTMAEIAEDAGMSAANLYRYFENKQDLAAACAGRCMDELVDRLREVVRRPGLTGGQRLEQFTLAMLRHTHEQVAEHPRVNELVEIITGERQDLVHERNRSLHALIREILDAGNASGEFDVSDSDATTAAVYGAIALFGVPFLMNLYPLPEYEYKARAVVALLIRGLAKR